MPTKPATICPKCGTLKRGECPQCGTGRRGWPTDRGTRQERGYDNDWIKLEARKKEANPFCEQCEREGRIVPTDQVHHIVAFKGRDDPLRLDWDNLESLCTACHAKETGGRRKHDARRSMR